MSDWLFDEQEDNEVGGYVGVVKYTLTDEEIKEQQIKELISINREVKHLQNKKIAVLSSLSDKEMLSFIFDNTLDIYKNILECDSVNMTNLDDFVLNVFDDLEDAKKFLKNKSVRWYRSGEVFNNYNEHPVQKKLRRNKVINATSAKRTTTPMALLNYLHKEKAGDERFRAMEERLSKLELEQANTASIVNSVIKDMDVMKDSLSLVGAMDGRLSSVEHNLSVVMEMVDEVNEKLAGTIDTKKIHCYAMFVSKVDKKVIQDANNISAKTMYRWVKQVREALGE